MASSDRGAAASWLPSATHTWGIKQWTRGGRHVRCKGHEWKRHACSMYCVLDLCVHCACLVRLPLLHAKCNIACFGLHLRRCLRLQIHPAVFTLCWASVRPSSRRLLLPSPVLACGKPAPSANSCSRARCRAVRLGGKVSCMCSSEQHGSVQDVKGMGPLIKCNCLLLLWPAPLQHAPDSQ
jgi:hypothetical protein